MAIKMNHGVIYKSKRDSLFHTVMAGVTRLLLLCLPPLIPKCLIKIQRLMSKKLPVLPKEFLDLPTSQHGLYKLISDFAFDSVLDIGSGAGEHALVFKKHGKKVTALDFGTSVYAQESHDNYTGISKVTIDFNAYETEEKYDCIWASHVLEHQSNPGAFIRKCMDLTKENGLICITVPPLKHEIVGGHLTLWNAGLLLYQLVFNGLDCQNASICSYGYNITIIVKKKLRDNVDLDYDSGDIRKLKAFFPSFIDEPFNGIIKQWNW